MKKILTLLFFWICLEIGFAQSYNITGTALDSTNNYPLIGANIVLRTPNKTTAGGSSTDSKGRFLINGVKPGVYTLNISYVGYRTKRQHVEVKKSSLDLKTILVAPGSYQTGEVDIVEKAPLIIQNQDTTEYMADAVKTNLDANAEDLVSKMPGIVVQDGKVQAHGEDVQTVLVDGKRYFGDDPNAVLKNIPAEIIEKIQVYDKQSDQSEFTGFNDGNTSKTINLVTRPKFRTGTFGKLSGGYGDQDKYSAGGNMNFFNEKGKLSLLGQVNNTNDQNFSTDDLLGVMSSSSGGRGGRGGGNFGGGGPGGGGPGGGNSGGGPGGGGPGGNVNNFLVSAKNGLIKTQAFGVNYVGNWDQKIDLTTSYFFNHANNDATTLLNRNYFLASSNNQKYNENSIANSNNTNHRFDMRLDYKIDTSNSILFSPKVSYQKNDGSSNTTGVTSVAFADVNSINTLFSSDLSAVSASSQLLYRHKFAQKGRTISLEMDNTYKKNNGDKDLYSDVLYYKNLSANDTTDQQANIVKNGNSISTNIAYTQPVTDYSILQFNGGYSQSSDKSDQRTYNYSLLNDSYSSIDTSSSNVYNKKTNTQSYGLGYLFRKDDFHFNFGVSYNIAALKNDQSFPNIISTEKKFYSFLPNAMFRYNFSQGQNLMIRYRASNTMPSVDQLQDYLDKSNTVQLTMGNPNLSQDFKHNLNLRYTLTDFDAMTSMFLILSGTITNNYIGYNTIIAQSKPVVYDGITLSTGTQLKIPQNVDGYKNLSSFLAYSLPIDYLKSVFNFNISVAYTRTPGILNSVTNFANTMSYGGGLIVSSNISQDLDFTVSTNETYNVSKNTSESSTDANYWGARSRLKFFWKFWSGFVLQTDLQHVYQGNLGSGYDPNSYAWNAYLGKKFLSKDQAEIRFTVNDILDKNTNITRTTNDYYIEESKTNVLGRYYQVSFVYNLKAF
jgi:hypothetical protein